MNIQLFLIDDHKVVLRGLELLFSEETTTEVIGKAQNIQEGLKTLESISPDVIISDLSLGDENGLDFIKEVRKSNKEVKIVVLTMHTDRNRILDAIEFGANAFVSKDANEDELIEAIKQVHQGNSYLSSTISNVLTNSFFNQNKNEPVEDKKSSITKREKEILKLITEGKSNKMIAEDLNISKKT